jgi:rhodanese-related sulfurtransferase
MFAKLSLFLAAASIAAAAMPAPASASDPFQTATMEQVQGWIAARDVVVYDVNDAEVYEKNHLPGARFLSGKAWTKTLPESKAARLVFYCSNPR